MEISLQRLGDNPRDHDGTFAGFNPPHKADVNGLRPDVDPYNADERPEGVESMRWNIYPSPPPRHWHWKAPGQTPGEGGEGYDESQRGPDGQIKGVPVDTYAQEKAKARETNGSEGFDMADCEIPGADNRGWAFEMDESGVYQIYEKLEEKRECRGHLPRSPLLLTLELGVSLFVAEDRKRLFRNVTLREYYTDLDYVLNVCSDGPAKSFAFRRLKYLQSKWSLYTLLNEYQEIADVKVN
jgi:AMP deaminase